MNSWQESVPELMVHPPRRSVRPSPVDGGTASAAPGWGSGWSYGERPATCVPLSIDGNCEGSTGGGSCWLASGGASRRLKISIAPTAPHPASATAKPTTGTTYLIAIVRFLHEVRSES